MAVSAGEIEATLRLRDQLTEPLKAAVNAVRSAGANMSGALETAADTAQSVATSFGSMAKVVIDNAGMIGGALTVGITVPMIAVGRASVEAATEYQRSMTKILTLTDASADSVAQWRKELTTIGPELSKGPQELAKGLFAVTSAGLTGAAAMDVLKDSTKASVIGLGDVNTVARAVTGALQSYSKEGLTSAEATAVLIATVREGNVEADALAGSLGRVTGMAASVGISFDQVGAYIATFTRLGVSAEEAVTALRGTIGVLELKEAPKAAAALATVGMTMASLRAEIKDKGLAAALLDLVQKFDGNVDALSEIIPNVRALAGVLGTAGSQGEEFVKVQERITASMRNGRAEIDGAFAKASENLAIKWERLKAIWESVKVVLGEKLLPLVGRMADVMIAASQAVLDLVQAFDRLPQGIQTAVGALAGMAFVAGPVLGFFGAVRTAIELVGPAFATFFGAETLGAVGVWGARIGSVLGPLATGVLPALGTALEAVGAALAAFLTPTAAVIAAVAAVAAGLLYMTGAWEQVTGAVDIVVQAVQDAGTVFGWLASEVLSELGKELSELWEMFKQFGAVLMSDIGGALRAIGGWIKGAVDWFSQLAATVKGPVVEAYTELLRLLVPEALQKAGSMMLKLVDVAKNVAAGLHEAAEAIKANGGAMARAEENAKGLGKSYEENVYKPSLSATDALALLNSELDKAKQSGTENGFDKLAASLAAAKKELADLKPDQLQKLSEAVRSGVFDMQRLKAETGLSEEALRLFEDRVKASGKALQDSNKEAAKFADSMAKLSGAAIPLEELDGALVEGIKYFLQYKGAAEDIARVMGTNVGVVKAVSEAMDLQAKFAEAARKAVGGYLDDFVEKTARAEKASRDFNNEAFSKNLTVQVDAWRKANADIVKMGEQRLANEIKNLEAVNGVTKKSLAVRAQLYALQYQNEITAIQEAAQAQKDKLSELGQGYDEAMAAIDVSTEQGMALAAMIYKQKIAEMAAESKKLKTSWQDMLGGLADAFAKLAQISGESFGKIAKQVGNVIGAMALAQQASKEFAKASEKGDVAGQALAMAGSVAALAQATSNQNAVANVAGGALTGAQTGQQIGSMFGPAGAAIGLAGGAIAGAVVGLFRSLNKPEYKKLAKDIGRDWGLSVSEGLAKQMEKDSKEFGRQAATLLNMDKIFAENGGIAAPGNFAKAFRMLHDVFSLIGTDQLTLAQGAEILDKNWSEMLAAGTDSFGFINEEMRQLIALNDQYGTQSKEIAKYLRQQADVAQEAANKIISGALTPQMQGWKDLRQAIDDATKSGKDNTENIKNMAGQADAAKASLEDLGTIAVATFGAAIANGASFSEALAAAKPGLTQLSDAFKTLGLETDNAALKALMLQANILDKNPELLQGVGALGDAFAALSNMGLLNTDTFAAMQRTGARMYTELQAKVAALGGGTRDALLPMQDYLHKAEQAAKELGVPLDDNTAEMIRQSKELGIWKETGKSAFEKVTDAVGDLVDKMDELLSRLFGLPRTVRTDVEVVTNTTTTGGGGAGGAGGGFEGGGGLPPTGGVTGTGGSSSGPEVGGRSLAGLMADASRMLTDTSGMVYDMAATVDTVMSTSNANATYAPLPDMMPVPPTGGVTGGGGINVSKPVARSDGGDAQSVAMVQVLNEIKALIAQGHEIVVNVEGKEIVRAHHRALEGGGDLLSYEKELLGIS